MTPARYEQLMELFDHACTPSGDARASLVEEVRTEHPAIADDLVELLEQDQARDDLFDSQDGRLDIGMLDGSADDTVVLGDDDDVDAPGAERSGPDPYLGLVIAHRYQLDERLGAGGMGQVYRAFDRQEERTVAVKLLRPDLIHNPRQVQRFRREFRAISRIEHPGCVSVFAQGVHGQHRFIVMEYVAGGNLSRLVGAPDSVLLPVLIQLTTALECVHSRRIIHRDLKLANVLLAAGDPPTPKLVDFGIVKVIDEKSTRLTGSGEVLGTIDYLAPEHLAGEPLDPRSDLYSLGCVIFELWAGRTPFVGAPFERLRARLDRQPTRLHELAPQAPKRLDELVARLLQRDPDKRPRRAADVARELAEIWVEKSGGASSMQALGSLSESRSGGFLYRPGLVGRESIQNAVTARIEEVATGAHGGLIAVHGAAGMGKTALMAELGHNLTRRGYRLVTVAVQNAGFAPFAPFPKVSSALDRALSPSSPTGSGDNAAAPDATHASSESERYRQSIVPADDAAVARRQLADEIATKLHTANASQPTVLILEDLHAADPSAMELLTELIGMLGEAAAPRDGSDSSASRCPVIVATMRPEGRANLEAAARQSDDISFIALERLDRAAVGQIAAGMLAVPESSVPKRLIEHLASACDGNPFLVQSALHELVHRGHLRLAPSGWTPAQDDLDTAVIKAVGDVVQHRLAALSDTTRGILAAGAICGKVFDVELLCRVARVPEDAVLDALNDGIRASVVRGVAARSGRDEYAFEHQRLAEALRDQLSEEKTRSYHDEAGEILRSRGTASPATLAFHFARGSDDSRAFHALREAGFWAFNARDYDAAQHHLRAALERVESLDEDTREAARIECIEPLADALVVAGHAHQGIELLRGLTGLEAPPTTRARWLRKLGAALMRTADVAGGLTMFERALALLGDTMPKRRLAVLWRAIRNIALTAGRRALRRAPTRDPAIEERAIIHRELAFMNRWIDLERSLAHLSAFVRLAHRLGADTYLVDAYAGSGFLYTLIGWNKRAARNHDKARQLAVENQDMYGLSRLEVMQGGTVAILSADEETAFAYYDKGVQVAEAVGDRFLLDFVLMMRGWGYAFLGRWQSAVEDFRRADALARELDVPWLRDDVTCGFSVVELCLGRFESASRAARQVLGSDVRLALPALEALATEILATEALMVGRFREAVAYFQRAQAHYTAHHLYRGWGLLTKAAYSEALVCLADEQGQDAIPDLMATLRRIAQRTRRKQQGVLLYRGYDDLLFGIYESRRGNKKKARRLFDRARTISANGGHPFMQLWMRARLAFEGWRLGDPREAVLAELEALDDIYESMGLAGMRSWLSRMREIHTL